MSEALRRRRWIPTVVVAILASSTAVHAEDSSTVEATRHVSPAPQFQAAMAYDAARKMVILFSNDGRGQTWAWDGHHWSLRHPRHSPGPRRRAQMAYDAARQRIVLFGGGRFTRTGTGSTLLGDTWTWDGVDWQQRSPTSSPSPRHEATMAYDPERRVVVLFGGYGRPNEFFYDTWAWDGDTWTLLTAATPPEFFANADAMAYDPATQRMIFFAFPGGASDQAMWFFDGVRWMRQKVTPGELPLFGEGMVYDDALGQIVEFGGEDAGAPPSGHSPRSDLWTWDGHAWSLVPTSQTPPPRADMSMAYDNDRRELVVFGGLDSADRPIGDTWTWDGSTWRER